jgi:hypothetical protein
MVKPYVRLAPLRELSTIRLYSEDQNAGRLLCQDPDLIIMAHTNLADVFAYRSDGRLVWRTQLEGFRRPKWIPGTEPRSMTRTADPKYGFASQVRSIVMSDDSTLAVTISESRATSPTTLSVQFLSIATGKLRRSAKTDVVIGAAARNAFYGYTNQPFPHLKIFAAFPTGR